MVDLKKYCKIYKLTNVINNKFYIGQTWLSLENRFRHAGSGYVGSTKLYNAIKKYGHKNFKYELLFKVKDQSEADLIEDYYIKTFNSQNSKFGYNIKNGGRAGRHSEETIIKIKKSLTGRNVSQETRAKISKIHKGKPKPKSDCYKKQVSKTMIEWHKNNKHPLIGVPRTKRQKLAQSKALKGKKQSKEVVKRKTEIFRERFKMTEREELKIISLYEDGLSYNAICKKLHINNRKIYRVFKKYNVAPRSNTENTNKNRWKEHNDFLLKSETDIIDMYKDHRYDISDIAKKYKTSFGRIYLILRKYNIK